MKLPNFTHTNLLVFFVLLFSISFSVSAKKNVLFLMADDFNYWAKCIGYYPEAQTPNLDALASKGVLFTQALCSSPVCNPSRNALWSGFRPSTTMIQGNSDGYVREKAGFANIVSLHQYFKNNGYYALGSGKLWHAGSMGDVTTDPTHWSEIWTDKTGCSGGTYKKYNGAKYGWSGNTSAMSESNCADYALAKKIAAKISNYHNSAQKDQPFFIGCGLFRPHTPFNSPKTFWDKFDNSKMLPGPGVETQWYSPGTGDSNHKEITNAGVWKDGIQGYLASMALSDYNIGIILDALDKSPLRDSTIVLFMGDHGWDLGEHGRWGKFARWNSANHTTMIIYDPSAKGNGQQCGKPVSMQDLYRTLIDLCGLPKKNDVEGYSIAHLLNCPTDAYWKHPAVMSYGGVNYIKTEDWYFINDGSKSELYNNIDDPYQWKNLYGNSKYISIVNDLKHQLDSIVAIGTVMKTDLINNNGVVKPEHYYIQQPETNTSCSCVDTETPTSPGAITTSVSSNSITVSWIPSTDNVAVSQYEIYFNNAAYAQTVNATISIDTLRCHTQYTIKVKAFDACSNASDFNTSVSVFTLECDTQPPTVPGSIIVDSISGNSIDLSWPASSDETELAGYEIYLNSELHGTSTLPSYQISALNCNTGYSIEIRAYDAANNYSEFTDFTNFSTLDCEACAVTQNGGNGADEGQVGYVANNIPGTIKAVNFDEGGQNVAYYELDGRATWAHPTFRTTEEIDIDEADGSTKESGAVIGGIAAGEWAEYTVQVATAGEYSLKIRYGCNGNKQVYFKVDNKIVGCLIDLPSTGRATTYDNFEVSKLLMLPEGKHTIAWVSESSSSFNLDEFVFELVNPSTNYADVIKPMITYLISPYVDKNHKLYLDLSYSDPSVELQIFNINGILMHTAYLSGERDFVPIDLPLDLSSGVYLLKINNDLTQSVEKFVVQ